MYFSVQMRGNKIDWLANIKANPVVELRYQDVELSGRTSKVLRDNFDHNLYPSMYTGSKPWGSETKSFVTGNIASHGIFYRSQGCLCPVDSPKYTQ